MILFRHCDSRYPFLWEDGSQPQARWHGAGEGPAHYLSDTPDGAWAEFLRHEELREPEDLQGLTRSIWAVEVPDQDDTAEPNLPEAVLQGGEETYADCQAEARRLRQRGGSALRAPSAALVAGGAGGQRVEGGLQEADPRDGSVLVLFGPRPTLHGWLCAQRRTAVSPPPPARQPLLTSHPAGAHAHTRLPLLRRGRFDGGLVRRLTTLDRKSIVVRRRTTAIDMEWGVPQRSFSDGTLRDTPPGRWYHSRPWATSGSTSCS